MSTDYLIRRDDIVDIRAVQSNRGCEAADGQIVVRIDSFALTANNITYAAAGESLKYWQFFPADDPQLGRVPVWGFGTVTQSQCDSIAAGERLFGFFPMTAEVVLTPGGITTHGLTDSVTHRAALPAIYNQYRRLGKEPVVAGSDESFLEDCQALLFPLFATSFLLADFLQENDWFGARQVVVTSASSKTAIGLMQLVARMSDKPQLVGLTSASNQGFVESLGCCDQVVQYSDLTSGLSAVPTLLVDLAGNTEVREALHQHLGNAIQHSCAVGTSHWDKFRPVSPMPGPKPKFFFAPAQSKKRAEQWGARELDTRLTSAWRDLSLASRDWLTIERGAGPCDVIRAYNLLASGQASPATGLILSP